MALQLTTDWAAQRGAILFEATVDIIGGFPGYADRGCMLYGAQLRITENYLLAAEDQQHGFGLPLSWIEGSALVSQPGRDDFALRIFYRDGSSPRLFTLRFRSSRIGARGIRRSVRAQETLHQAGLTDRFAANPPAEPDFTLPWDQTREFEHENVIWTGRATAPVRVGAETAPSEVWLTTKSLIWGSGDGEGINRIPLSLLMDLVSTRLRDRLGTPIIYVAIGDESTGRFELPFSFDLQSPPDRNFRERGAFLVGLRSRAIADGTPAPYSQPWRPNLLSSDPVEIESGQETVASSPDELADVEPRESLSASPTFFGTSMPDEAPPAWPKLYGEAAEQWRLGSEPVRRRGGLGGRLARQQRTHADATVEPLDASTELAPEDAIPAGLEFAAESSGENEDSPAFETAAIEPQDAEPAPAIAEIVASPLEVGVAEEKEDPTERFTIVEQTAPVMAEASVTEDVVLAEWSAPDLPVSEPSDLPLSESWAAISPSIVPEDTTIHGPDDLAVDDAAGDGIAPVEVVDQVQAAAVETMLLESVAGEPWAAVRRYEETAVGALAEALRIIDDRIAGRDSAPLAEHAPSSWDQARALAELNDLVQRASLSPDDARHRKERLLALGDVCVRLRTLVELHGNGYLTIDDLDQKRAKLVRSLSNALVRLPAHTGPITDVA
jgi:hypothetical protein